jgi:hypothetical protein
VQSLLDKAGVQTVPGAAAAVFVGTEFDSLAGRGGKDGTPLRRTPWGDIAFQLSGEQGFGVVAKHDAEGTAPSTEVIRNFLPKGKPALILIAKGNQRRVERKRLAQKTARRSRVPRSQPRP